MTRFLRYITWLRPALIYMAVISVLMPAPTLAVFSWDQIEKVSRNSTQWYDPNDCTGVEAPPLQNPGPESLQGHVIPATKGFTGEEGAIDDNGTLADSGQTITFPDALKNAPADLKKPYEQFYITMRWRYAKWNWDGTPVQGPEDKDFYTKAPRVIVTNPTTKKSIIAVVLNAGPAPWTGVDPSQNNDAKQGWNNPQDGTPTDYKGRVSGLPKTAIQALGAKQKSAGEDEGDELTYYWAPNQKAKPGPAAADGGPATDTSNNPPQTCCASDSSVDGGSAVAAGGDQILAVYNFLVGPGLGFSKEQGAGILGNLKQESGVDFKKEQTSGGSAKGLAQWEGSRFTDLQAFAAKSGKQWNSDLQVQLDFMKQELTGSHKSALTAVKAAKSVEDATGAWETSFEGASIPALGQRVQYANDIFKNYASRVTGTTSSDSGTCPSNDGGGNGDIVKTALKYAWPDNKNHQGGNNAKPEYKADNVNPKGDDAFTDCGTFVATVVRKSNVDANYPVVGTPGQMQYVEAHPDKWEVDKSPKAEKLQPGDILIEDGHTEIYVGQQPGGYVIASASWHDFSPQLNDASDEKWMLSQPGVISARLKK